MADGFIVRKGGVAVERTTAPSINFVSKTDSEIVVTFTNNDAAEAEVYYGITSTLTDTVTLAAAATSSNITFSGLDDDTAFTVSAFAIVTDPTSKKIKSEIVTSTITTDETPLNFTAATGGTTLEYDSGGKRFRSHTFTSNGNFVVSTVGDNVDDRNKVDYLIIAGGAGGGFGKSGGGGGAGGFRTTITPVPSDQSPNAKVTVTATTFGIVVGAGGTKGSAGDGQNGVNSSAFNITSTGGGGGSRSGGKNGGSGGGGSLRQASGGTGILGQGRNGSASFNGAGNVGGGAGGGAGQVGQASTSTKAGNGGDGLANLLRTGSNETRAGGGGGGRADINDVDSGTGGLGGGGNGATTNTGQNATTNTGSGGGGGMFASALDADGGNGGSGIVIIRYEIATV